MAVVQRRLTVEFGPSRSKRFGKAVAEAHSGPGDCSELEPGRYRVRFLLGEDAATYRGFFRLLERVRHWRATEVYEEDELVSSYHAREMAWCAFSQLTSFGACRWRFYYGIPPRCAFCPLFDVQQALRDTLGETTPLGQVLEISFEPNFRALGEEHPPLDPLWKAPDYPPTEWGGVEEGEPPR